MSQKEASYFRNRLLNEGLAFLKDTRAWPGLSSLSVSLSSQAYQDTFFFESPDFWLNQGKQGQELLIPGEKATLRDCEKEGFRPLLIQQSLCHFPFPSTPSSLTFFLLLFICFHLK